MKRQRCWGKPNLLRMPSEALKAAVQTIGRKVKQSIFFFFDFSAQSFVFSEQWCESQGSSGD